MCSQDCLNPLKKTIATKKPYILACIPAYNEEKTIAKVILKTKKYVDKVIVCDDGSADMTAEIAEALGAEVIRHERNMGYGAAICSLFKKARKENADLMITLDADGQHDPDYIPKLIEPIINGEADIVIGSRFMESGNKNNIPYYRKIGIKMLNWIIKVKNKNVTDVQSGYRVYSKKALKLIKPVETGMGVSTEILLKAFSTDLKIKEIPIQIYYEVDKPSKMNPILHGLDVTLNTLKYLSLKHPLISYGLPGMFLLLITFISGLWMINLFNTKGYFSIPLALITLGSGIIGILLCLIAITLWAFVTLIRELKEQRAE